MKRKSTPLRTKHASNHKHTFPCPCVKVNVTTTEVYVADFEDEFLHQTRSFYANVGFLSLFPINPTFFSPHHSTSHDRTHARTHITPSQESQQLINAVTVPEYLRRVNRIEQTNQRQKHGQDKETKTYKNKTLQPTEVCSCLLPP